MMDLFAKIVNGVLNTPLSVVQLLLSNMPLPYVAITLVSSCQTSSKIC